MADSQHTPKIGVLQNATAIVTGGVAMLFVLFQVAVVAFNMCLFMELFQFETTTYLISYISVSLGLVMIWLGLHSYFVGRFRPTENGTEHDRVTSVELSRVRALQLTTVATTVFLTVASLIFESRFPGDIAVGDGHIVQNGMDTRSAVYSLWLTILIVITVSASYVVSHAVYLPDLYFRQFRKHFKANQN